MTRALASSVLLATAIAVMLSAPAHASFPGANGRLYFNRDLSDPSGGGDIWSMFGDGSDATPFVEDAGPFDGQPAVSADGRQIAFVSDRDGADEDIFVQNADGTNLRQITHNDAIDDSFPAWSPDGTRIVFNSNRDGPEQLYTMSSTDGSDVQRITNSASDDNAPRWSPDGSRIAFDASGTGGNDIFTVAPTGGPTTNVTQSSGVGERHPDWSPDGTRFSFDADNQIWIVNANGSGAHEITSNGDTKQRARWSPDGTKLMYAEEVDLSGQETDEVFVVGADGSSPTNLSNLTAGQDEDFQGDWAVAVPPPPPPIPPAKFAGLSVARQSVTVSRKRVASIAVSCPAATNGSCAGTLTLKTAKAVKVTAATKKKRRHKPKRRVLTLGHAKFTIAPGKTAKVRVKLSKAAFKLLVKSHSLKTTATVVSHDAVPSTVTSKVSVKLKAPKKAHKKHHHS